MTAEASTPPVEDCTEQKRLCFALALWNGRDPILKERIEARMVREQVSGKARG
jgi:hypothetical protein